MSDPMQYACSHTATPQEQERDASYTSCGAQAGQPCAWAKRWAGVADPAFHSERIEAAALAQPVTGSLSAAQFIDDVLKTGLV